MIAEIFCRETGCSLGRGGSMYLIDPEGAEVDFVVEEAGKIMAIEVKSAELARPGLSRSGRSFIAAYNPEKFVVLNRSLETTLTIDNCQIDFQTPYNMN